MSALLLLNKTFAKLKIYGFYHTPKFHQQVGVLHNYKKSHTIFNLKGEIIPMESCGHDNAVRDAIINATKLRMDVEPSVNVDNLIAQFLAHCRNALHEGGKTQQEPTIATINQQIAWSKFCDNTSKPVTIFILK